MNVQWKGVVGAVGGFVTVSVVRHYLGTVTSVVVVAILLLAWGLLHLYAKKRLDGLCEQFQNLNQEQKETALTELDPEIRAAIEKRVAMKRNH